MLNNETLLKAIADNIDEGLLYIDRERIFRLINKKAKEIIGLVLDQTYSHPGGQVETGDIVIIADNCIGDDDGDFSPKDLTLLNINDPDIQQNDLLIAVGVYKNPEIKPVYKYLRGINPANDMRLDTVFLGFEIEAEINPVDSFISIRIGSTTHKMSFFKSIGHLVIIDGKTGQIKFFQAKGYTLRRETLAQILHGRPFLPKGRDMKEINVIGSKFDEVAEHNDLTDKISAILNNEDAPVMDQFYEINKRLTLCSLIPVRDETYITGVLLKIRDASALEDLLEDRNQLLEKVENRQIKATPINTEVREELMDGFAGSSPAMKEVKYLAVKASKARFNVLLTGESGTGKSRLAYEIHSLYKKDGPFVEVNCGSIPPNLFESELFGYAPGAFTGALDRGKAGYFEMADGGTIFLDEIGEVPVDIQVKLLQVLQTKRFFRVGSSKPTDIDVRVIAATNINLEAAVDAGTFRQDLFYRINVFPIEIPPLRERKGDIYLLINRILKKVCQEYGLPEKQFSGIALNKMLRYDWPGNVRELENIIERAVTICDSQMIFPEHINIRGFSPGENSPSHMTLKAALEQVERHTIEETLRQCGGDKVKAMELLDVSKSAFYEKLKKYSIS